MRFFCPGCRQDFGDDHAVCPYCGLDVDDFYQDKDYVDKLILALGHPEPSTAIRAAWLLGKRREQRAVDALINVVRQSKDIYLVRAAAKALILIGGQRSTEFVRSLTEHPDFVVRRLVGGWRYEPDQKRSCGNA
jgi:HEAT repeat protein